MKPALDLDAIRPCLEGTVPGLLATCSEDGVPNASYLSQVEYVDAGHLALSFQFFNKTRRNVLANPQVELLVSHPLNGALYRIAARFLRTETSGPLFERMRAKLAGIASHTGMSGVFRLRGADVYAVQSVAAVHGDAEGCAAPAAPLLGALRRCADRIGAAADLDALVESLLDGLVEHFGIRQAQLLAFDAAAGRLFTLGSRGYGRSGAGAEIALDEGVIGVAARERCAIRINHATRDYAYLRSMRDGAEPAREIPLPGLAEPGSQLALPLLAAGALQGVLFVESAQELRFGWDDEDALALLAAQVALQLRSLQACPEADAEPAAEAAPPAAPGDAAPLRVRHYAQDHSVFFDDEYLIKGVAGAVLWKLLQLHQREGRREFSNRELRLDASLGLPPVADNLETRLLTLQRRLAERQGGVRLERCGRGRLRLDVGRRLQLSES